MKDINLGLGPRPKLFSCNGFYRRYVGNFDEDEAGLGNGLGLFYDLRIAQRIEKVETDRLSSASNRKYIKRNVIEEWKQLRISIVFGRYICDFYIRLWRVK
jgi:hypothetical protein